MKIERVIYTQLFSFGDFQNERIGFEAVLEEGEDPGEAILKLKEKTEEQFRLHRSMDSVRNRLTWIEEGIEERIGEIRNRLAELEAALDEETALLFRVADVKERIDGYERALKELKAERENLIREIAKREVSPGE